MEKHTFYINRLETGWSADKHPNGQEVYMVEIDYYMGSNSTDDRDQILILGASMFFGKDDIFNLPGNYQLHSQSFYSWLHSMAWDYIQKL